MPSFFAFKHRAALQRRSNEQSGTFKVWNNKPKFQCINTLSPHLSEMNRGFTHWNKVYWKSYSKQELLKYLSAKRLKTYSKYILTGIWNTKYWNIYQSKNVFRVLYSLKYCPPQFCWGAEAQVTKSWSACIFMKRREYAVNEIYSSTQAAIQILNFKCSARLT